MRYIVFFCLFFIGASSVEYNAKVLRVLDGDTLDVELDLGFGIYKRDRIRIYGIDTPEIHSKKPSEKALGLEAKKALEDCVASGAKFRPVGNDKYGRMLGDVTCSGTSASTLLIKNGLGRAYFGDKKKGW